MPRTLEDIARFCGISRYPRTRAIESFEFWKDLQNWMMQKKTYQAWGTTQRYYSVSGTNIWRNDNLIDLNELFAIFNPHTFVADFLTRLLAAHKKLGDLGRPACDTFRIEMRHGTLQTALIPSYEALNSNG